MRPDAANFESEEPLIDDIDDYAVELKVLKSHADEVEKKLKDLYGPDSFHRKVLNLRSFQKEHSIHKYQYYKITVTSDKNEQREICKQLTGVDGVAFCTMSPDVRNLRPPLLIRSDDVDEKAVGIFNTPDFSDLQTYLDDKHGMNIRHAWAQGYTGDGVTIRHLDFGVYKNHEDFQGGNITVIKSRPETEDCNHGTCSTGIIAAADNGFGVKGIAHKASFKFYDTDFKDLILEQAQPADIVSLDIQFSKGDDLLPVLISKAWWDVVHNLSEKGVTVLMAAGNGGLDLSDTTLYNDYGDCGVLLVGACSPETGRKLAFSNYGHPQSVINSWGLSVTTTGGGDLQKLPGHERDYTRSFNGTSSATPLSSAAVTLMQCYAKKQGYLISPRSKRSLISESTYDEGVTDRIGKRPNVAQLFTRIDNRLLSPLSRENPFPPSSGFINYTLTFDSTKDDEKSLNFDFRNTTIRYAGIVAHYSLEGPSALEWIGFGSTLAKIPVLNAEGESYVLYLRVGKYSERTLLHMNSAADLQGNAPQNFDFVLQFKKDDNRYLPAGNYNGIFPVSVQSWVNKDYKLPVNINILVR